jgi:hypothetical protein
VQPPQALLAPALDPALLDVAVGAASRRRSRLS